MSDPITQKLDEMKARCDAATEGPWDWLLCVDKATPSVLIAREEGGEVRTFISSLWLDDEDGLSDMSKADADFIAHARTDMPKLIAALKEIAHYASRYPCYCLEDDRPDPEGCYCSGDGHGPTSCADCLTHELHEIVAKALGVEL